MYIKAYINDVPVIFPLLYFKIPSSNRTSDNLSMIVILHPETPRSPHSWCPSRTWDTWEKKIRAANNHTPLLFLIGLVKVKNASL